MEDFKYRRNEILHLRFKGQTYQQIAEQYGVSRQRIAQIVGKPGRNRGFSEEECIYPGLRKWLNDRRMTKNELCRRLGYKSLGCSVIRLSSRLNGQTELRKQDIDGFIRLTGLSYEVLFGGAK